MDKVDQIIEGLQIFKKYGHVDTAAEHDEFYAGCDEEVSEEDQAKLVEIGWMNGENGWSIFT